MEQRTEKVVAGNATIRRFLQAVWKAAQKEGWPVNAYMIGPDVFKGDHVANWYAIRAVLQECQTRQLLEITTGGEIQSMSDVARVLATSVAKPHSSVLSPPPPKRQAVFQGDTVQV